jgi:hypothetical protein
VDGWSDVFGCHSGFRRDDDQREEAMNVTEDIDRDVTEEDIDQVEELIRAARRLMTYVQEAAPTDIPNLTEWCRKVDNLFGPPAVGIDE